jgi:mono/diheme cytochrome c family protein
MKIKLTLMAGIIASMLLINCGGETTPKKSFAEEMAAESAEAEAEIASNEMENVGIGPIKELVFDKAINMNMAKTGEAVFETSCSACHKTTKKFIGPSPQGIYERRNPAWVMNMILNPEEMVEKDPIAKKLLAEFLSPMANQNLTEEEARSVAEFFRTLK